MELQQQPDGSGKAVEVSTKVLAGFSKTMMDRHPVKAPEYQFRDCTINVLTREVRLAGVQRVATKKVFDFLMYLIERRGRVIPREELLEKIWAGRVVTDNVLARTAMLARALIGDTIPEQPLIKTVVGVGYRFTGDLLVGASKTLTEPIREQPVLRLGLLPFQNETGNPTLAWVELGLLALVIQSLAADSRLNLPSTASVLMALEELSDASQDARVSHLRAALTLDAVVAVTVKSIGTNFELTFSSFGTQIAEFAGSVRGPELTQLASRFSRDLQRRLFCDETLDFKLEFADSFVNECLARGIKASAERNWQFAEKALSIVHELHPDNLSVKTYLAYAQARLGKASAHTLAAELIDTASEDNDCKLRLRAHYISALATLECDHQLDQAIMRCDNALALGVPDSDDDWYMLALALKNHLCYLQLDFESCRALCDLGMAACARGGNKLALIAVLTNRGALQYVTNDRPASLLTSTQAIELSRQLQRPQAESIALANHFLGVYDSGRFLDAIKTAQLYTARLMSLREPPMPQIAAMAILNACYSFHRPDLFEIFHSQLQEYLWVKPNMVNRAMSRWGGSLALRVKGQFAKADGLMNEALQLLAKESHYFELSSALPSYLVNLARRNAFEEMSAAIELISAFPEFPRDKKLRGPINYVRAIEARALGDNALCLELMALAFEHVYQGEWRASIGFDLAWIQLEMNQVTAAANTITELGAWADEHPNGLLVKALLHYRLGEVYQAATLQRAYAAVFQRSEQVPFADMQNFYDNVSKGKAAVRFPISSVLPIHYQIMTFRGWPAGPRDHQPVRLIDH